MKPNKLIIHYMKTFFPGGILFIFFLAVPGCKDVKPVKDISRPAKMIIVGEKIGKFKKIHPGQTKAIRDVELAFRVAGQLKKLSAVEGKKVKKGQLIAQLDPRDFNSDISLKGAEYTKANKEYQRQKGLFEKDVIAKSSLETHRRNRDVALANLRLAQDALKDATLKAPFDGVVGKRYVDNFENVNAKQPIVFLQDLSKIEIVLYISESAVASRTKKETIDAIAKFDAFPDKEFPCKLKEFSTQPDPKTKTYRVSLIADIPKEYKVIPGMNVNVIHFFRYKNTKDVGKIFIPADAVFNEGKGRTFVWIVKHDMKVSKNKVDVGNIKANEIEIRKGLNPGSRIVVAGMSYLREGMKVREYKCLTCSN